MLKASRSLLSIFTNHPECIKIGTTPHSVQVILNREKHLNTLSLELLDALQAVYKELHRLPAESRVVVVKGAGKKAFCAGGDIHGILTDTPKGMKKRYCYTADQVNYAVMTSPQPNIVIWDGLALGGGVGISVQGSHRLTSEEAIFSMPETLVGFVPGAGGSWFFPRLPHEGMGMYLALTGYRLKGADIVHAGLGTHYVTSSAMLECEKELLALGDPKRSKVDAIIEKYASKDLPEFSLKPHLSEIEDIFGPHTKSVEDVLEKLKSRETEWSKKTTEVLMEASPIALKMTYLLQCKGKTITNPIDIFKIENFAFEWITKGKDLDAGVPAVLKHKSAKGLWVPPTLAEVSDEMVEACLGPYSSNSVVWDPALPYPE